MRVCGLFAPDLCTIAKARFRAFAALLLPELRSPGGCGLTTPTLIELALGDLAGTAGGSGGDVRTQPPTRRRAAACDLWVSKFGGRSPKNADLQVGPDFWHPAAIGRSGDGGQAGTAEEEADDGTSEANSLGCASQQPKRSPTWPGRSVQSRLPRPRRRRQQSPSDRRRPRAESRQVVNRPLCKEPLIVALASGRSDCHHRGRVDACSRRGSFPAP
jgi:hypothetical protein